MKPYYSSRIWAKTSHPVTEGIILVEVEYSIKKDEKAIFGKRNIAVITSVKTENDEVIDVNSLCFDSLWRLEDLALMDYNEGGKENYGEWK